MVKKRRSAALADRDRAQEADAQVPYQLRLQNARRAIREARSVRARQDGERSGGDGEKEKRLLSYHLRLNVEKQASFGGLLFKDKKSLFWSQVDTRAPKSCSVNSFSCDYIFVWLISIPYGYFRIEKIPKFFISFMIEIK